MKDASSDFMTGVWDTASPIHRYHIALNSRHAVANCQKLPQPRLIQQRAVSPVQLSQVSFRGASMRDSSTARLRRGDDIAIENGDSRQAQ